MKDLLGLSGDRIRLQVLDRRALWVRTLVLRVMKAPAHQGAPHGLPLLSLRELGRSLRRWYLPQRRHRPFILLLFCIRARYIILMGIC